MTESDADILMLEATRHLAISLAFIALSGCLIRLVIWLMNHNHNLVALAISIAGFFLTLHGGLRTWAAYKLLGGLR